MKKLGFLFLSVFAVTLFVSCSKDSDGDYPAKALIATVRTLDDGGYYFERNNHETLFPGDRSRVPSYAARDGQRAIIWFSLLSDVAGYDYNIELYAVENIFTGKSETVSDAARLDELGNAATSITPANCSLSREWLTLHVGYPVTDHARHSFTLVVNEVEEPEEHYDGYLDVELRHNPGGDLAGYTHFTYISFDLSGISERLAGMQGVTLRIRTQQNGTKYLRFDLPKEE